MATKWGVVSAGKIAHEFVTAVKSIPGADHEFVAIAARSLERGRAFAAGHGIPTAYGSYERLAADPDVEIVHVGTVNSHHLRVGKMMLESGKHVLMEKPMALSLKQTETLVETARKNGRFLMEGLWGRFFPSYRCLVDLLGKGTIGEAVHVEVSFGQPLLDWDRLTRKALGGGTVLDLGIYALSAVNMVFGGEAPTKIAAVGHRNEEGVDISMASSLQFSRNRTANVTTSAIVDLPSEMTISGTKGRIKVPRPMWCPTVIQTPDQTLEFPLPDTLAPCLFPNSSGLRYEAMAVRECLARGELESPVVPWKDSLTLAAMIDEIHRQIGVSYPDE